MAGKRYHEIGFANTVSDKRAVSLSFELEFTGNFLDILSHPKCTIEPTMGWARRKFT